MTKTDKILLEKVLIKKFGKSNLNETLIGTLGDTALKTVGGAAAGGLGGAVTMGALYPRLARPRKPNSLNPKDLENFMDYSKTYGNIIATNSDIKFGALMGAKLGAMLGLASGLSKGLSKYISGKIKEASVVNYNKCKNLTGSERTICRQKVLEDTIMILKASIPQCSSESDPKACRKLLVTRIKRLEKML